MKTRSWRLVAHVSLMGIVGSLIIPLVVGVETYVGATNKIADHSLVGMFWSQFTSSWFSLGECDTSSCKVEKLEEQRTFCQCCCTHMVNL
jgi:hypothetical protein